MSAKYKYVYGLFSEVGGECLYVGCTSDPRSRYSGHMTNKTTGKERFVFTILKKVRARYGAREEARTIKRFRDLGQARFNRSLCACSLNRTIDETAAIAKVKDAKMGDVFIVTDSDAGALMSAARIMRQLEIKNITFDSEPLGKKMRLTARV